MGKWEWEWEWEWGWAGVTGVTGVEKATRALC
jgi:hypothetical protein